MCWADKLGVLWGLIVVLFFVAIAEHKAGLFTPVPFAEMMVFVIPVWIVLRIIDWIAGGPERRHGQIRARVIR